MRILLVNKYYYLRSGTERYLFNLKRLLESRGHSVEVFAMRDPRNEPATYSEHFVPTVDFHQMTPLARLGAAVRVIWYPAAARRIARVLDAFRPDLVHLFNIYHHLSPSLLVPITRRGIPIVQTLNDYKLICPNYMLYTESAPCTRCRNRRYFQAVRHCCVNGSRAWSALAALEMTLHKRWRVYERHVAAFIAPSAFVRDTAESFGIPAHQLITIPLFLFPDDFAPPAGDAGYCAYVGRLVPNKGLLALLRAARRLPEVPVWLVGDGPMRARLEQTAGDWELRNVRFSGHLAEQGLHDALAGARFTVAPSEWYEVFGQSIIESFALARPVIGARIGAIPELIDDGPDGDGLLFAPGNDDQLAACLHRLWSEPEEARARGCRGLRKVRTEYDPETHYAHLSRLYGRLASS